MATSKRSKLQLIALNNILLLLITTSTGYSNSRATEQVQDDESEKQLARMTFPSVYEEEAWPLESFGVYDVSKFGAQGDGVTDDSVAFTEAWSQVCRAKKASALVVPGGRTFIVGPTIFSGPCVSRISVQIFRTIVAPSDPNIWTSLDSSWWLLFINLPSGLSLEGGGILNGRGASWWANSCKKNRNNPCKLAPTAVEIIASQEVHVNDLQFINSQGFHLAFVQCTNVKASNLHINSPAYSPNTDGIHVEHSRNVSISGSKIGTGDDCISIGTGSIGIAIQQITCGPGHGISVGSLGKGTPAYVNGVKVKGVTFEGTKNGVRIKTWKGGSGSGNNMIFENLRMFNVDNPIIINQYYEDKMSKVDDVVISQIIFKNIVGTSSTTDAMQFLCSTHSPCKNIHLENIQLMSQFGSQLTSRCENAFGTTTGAIDPQSCLS